MTHLARGIIRDDVSRLHYFNLQLLGEVLAAHGVAAAPIQQALLNQAYDAEDREPVAVELAPLMIDEGEADAA